MTDEYEPLREAAKGRRVTISFQMWSHNGGSAYETAPHGDVEAGMKAFERVRNKGLGFGDSMMFVWLRAAGSTVPHIIVDTGKNGGGEESVRWWLEQVAAANERYDADVPGEVLPLVRRLLSEHEQRAAGLRSYESPSGWLSGRSV